MMMTSRYLSSSTIRCNAAMNRNAIAFLSNREFSLDCAPAIKLRTVFAEYRQKNYSRELPSRFQKDIVQACCNGAKSNNDVIQVDNLNRMLVNIGRSDQILSEEELSILLKEAGVPNNTRCLSTASLLELV